MPRPYTKQERAEQLEQLQRLYVRDGKTIFEVAEVLGISYQAVFDRLKIFGIPSNPKFKRRQDVRIPDRFSADLAEFFGVMLGDGHLSHFQVTVTLGTKEIVYARYLVELIEGLFGVKPKIAVRDSKYKVVYFGSVAATEWLQEHGLVYNKMRAQVAAPKWILGRFQFMKRFLRGFFDTDGSVYKLRWGMQVSFCNRSMPLLKSVRNMLLSLKYSPSQISGYNLYLTKKTDIKRFFYEIQPRNMKHVDRYRSFLVE